MQPVLASRECGRDWPVSPTDGGVSLKPERVGTLESTTTQKEKYIIKQKKLKSFFGKEEFTRRNRGMSFFSSSYYYKKSGHLYFSSKTQKLKSVLKFLGSSSICFCFRRLPRAECFFIFYSNRFFWRNLEPIRTDTQWTDRDT